MTAWLRRAAAAAATVSERPDLWTAGALASLAYVGWLPLLLAIAPPTPGDVADLAVTLYSSGSFPANVIALSVAGVAGFVLLCLLAAAAEVSLVRALRPDRHAAGAGEATLSALAVVLLASAPVAVAVAWLLLAAVANAPAVYTAPGPDATVIPRLVATLVPQLAAVGVTLLAAQALGGRLLRSAITGPGDRLAGSLRDGTRAALRRPGRWLGLAAVSWTKDALLVVGSWALLRGLWDAIADSLGAGLLGRPQALVLLVGFVAIWLILLLVGGALHAFISAWWLLEEEREAR